MSYRELRNFAEIMRALGYPRLISVENFRNPNFELVADILNWLVHRYDPNLQLPFQIFAEQERIEFLKLTSEFMYTKARIKLNTKNLYSADGYAVKELLKISTLLYNSIRNKINDDQPDSNSEDMNINLKVNELKTTRSLASEITTIGASIFDLLGSEIELREARTSALAKNLSTEESEKSLRQTIQMMGERMSSLLEKVENLTADEGSLEHKIEKKKADLDRFKNRLRSLKEVRPAFMDEYYRLESDLQRQYVMYLERFRNLEYLENELEQLHRTEQDAYEESQKHLKKLQTKSEKDTRSFPVNNLSSSLDDEDDFGDTNRFSSAEATKQAIESESSEEDDLQEEDEEEEERMNQFEERNGELGEMDELGESDEEVVSDNDQVDDEMNDF